MEVILTQDVESLGMAGQVVNVAAGYARNKLIPARLALEANQNNMKMLEKKRAEFEVRLRKEKEGARMLAKQIESVHLTLAQKAGEKDKLYGSVTTMEINRALAEQGLDIDRRQIRLTEPIKSLGEHEVIIKLPGGVTASIKVSVVRAE
ncbi:MAG: 50S ribosomal protein L9 [Pseudomonadota bacterium]